VKSRGIWDLGLLCLGFGIGTLGLGLCLLNLGGKYMLDISIITNIGEIK